MKRNEIGRRELSVGAVARQAGVSRRLLERIFRRELGYSILHEIRRVRTDRRGQLLVETQLPVREVAEGLGFNDARHFARYYRSVRNVSPLAYRRLVGGQLAPEAGAQISDFFPQSGIAGSMPEWYSSG